MRIAVWHLAAACLAAYAGTLLSAENSLGIEIMPAPDVDLTSVPNKLANVVRLCADPSSNKYPGGAMGKLK